MSQDYRNRNPLERVVESPLDLPAVPSANRDLGRSIPPGTELRLPDLPGAYQDRFRERTGRINGRFRAIPFNAGVANILIDAADPFRYYLIAINNSAAARIFLGFDYEPNANNGVVLEINLGFYEPWVCPTNAINAVAAGANTPGILLVASDRNE